MARTPKEWASVFFNKARTLNELLDLRRLVDNEWTGCGRYYAMRGGLARAEIDVVYRERLTTLTSEAQKITAEIVDELIAEGS